MKWYWIFLTGALLPLSAVEVPHEIGEQIPAIILKDGSTLTNAEIVGIEYVIRHDEGVTRVNLGGFRPGKLPPVDQFFSEKMLKSDEELLKEATAPSPGESGRRPPTRNPVDSGGVWEGLEWGDESYEVYSHLKSVESVNRLQGGALQLRAEVNYEGETFYLYPDIKNRGLYRIRIRGQYYDSFGDPDNLRREWEILLERFQGRFGDPLVSRDFATVFEKLDSGIHETHFWETEIGSVRLSLNQVEDRVYAIAYILKDE